MGNTFTTTSASGGGGADDGLPRYLTLDQAVALAANLPSLPAWAAANTSRQWSALALATMNIDGGRRYQGRKWDPLQTLQFPRVAYESSSGPGNNPILPTIVGPYAYNPYAGADVIWDYDLAAQQAVVPVAVQIACLYQSDSILSGKRAKLIDRLYDGLTSQSVGGASESYDLAAARAGGITMALCPRASELLEQYRLQSGKML